MATGSGHGAPIPNVAEVAQARASIWTVIFALLALFVSSAALILQIFATREQLRVNDELRAEKRTEYAMRVSWWR